MLPYGPREEARLIMLVTMVFSTVLTVLVEPWLGIVVAVTGSGFAIYAGTKK